MKTDVHTSRKQEGWPLSCSSSFILLILPERVHRQRCIYWRRDIIQIDQFLHCRRNSVFVVRFWLHSDAEFGKLSFRRSSSTIRTVMLLLRDGPGAMGYLRVLLILLLIHVRRLASSRQPGTAGAGEGPPYCPRIELVTSVKVGGGGALGANGSSCRLGRELIKQERAYVGCCWTWRCGQAQLRIE